VAIVGAEEPGSFGTRTRPSGRITHDLGKDHSWCGELTLLRERLAAAGTHVDVERAIEAGVQPIKRARLGAARDADARREDEAPSLRTRTLDRD
jgi:hypothetical protein